MPRWTRRQTTVIEVKVKAGDILARIKRAQEALSDLSQANRDASIAIYSWVMRNFDSDGGNVGGWAPLSPKYAARKQRRGLTKMLVVTGDMRRGFAYESNDTTARVYNLTPYARYHEEGTSRMPQRRLLPNKAETKDIAMTVYRWHVQRAMSKV